MGHCKWIYRLVLIDISSYHIKSVNSSLAPRHARGENVDAFVLAQLKYIISDKHIKQLVLTQYSNFLFTYAIFSL